jgi:TRAP-type C4-dicarboxylate transport system substrate-binding protein
MLLFSGPVWQRLNEDERKVLRDAGTSSEQFWRKAIADEDQLLLKLIGEKLVISPLSPEARREMEQLAQPVIDKHMGALDPKFSEMVRGAIGSVRGK